MQHLATRASARGHSGVRFFALDNEPALWNETHHDVFPSPLTYDQYWSRTQQYAAAIKQKDPAASSSAPWTGAGAPTSSHPPTTARSGGPGRARESQFLDWYLKRPGALRRHGRAARRLPRRHYYPQSPGVSLSDDESAATQALRLRSLKPLRPGVRRRVLDRWHGLLRVAWCASSRACATGSRRASPAPGSRSPSTAGRRHRDGQHPRPGRGARHLRPGGVDLATRWVVPADGSRIEDAFTLYLNYDGSGRVQGSA
jgi:hypothetical protein